MTPAAWLVSASGTLALVASCKAQVGPQKQPSARRQPPVHTAPKVVEAHRSNLANPSATDLAEHAEPKAAKPDASAPAEREPEWTAHYRAAKHGVVQQLWLRELDARRIRFRITQTGACTRSISGIADSGEPGDLESASDPDDEGIPTGFFVTDYTYQQGECVILINVGMESEDDPEQALKAVLGEASCATSCPLVPVLLRRDRPTQSAPKRPH